MGKEKPVGAIANGLMLIHDRILVQRSYSSSIRLQAEKPVGALARGLMLIHELVQRSYSNSGSSS